jgi:DNA-binding response OmpR family regulator
LLNIDWRKGTFMTKLFIIDDDKLITSIYSDFFSAKGYIVASSNSPFGVTTGIRLLDPDVVIVDMNLPVLSGKGLLNIIDYKGSYKVVLISGDEQKEEMKALAESGLADDYFIKGEPLANLGDKISTLLGPKNPLARCQGEAQALGRRN